jgi:hypothetical protein
MKALTVRQAEILTWIGEGCPERDWPDYTHRTTAKVLQNQGLVKVKGHGSGWTATVTEAGRAALAGGPSKQSASPAVTPRSARASTPTMAAHRPGRGEGPPPAVSAEDLVDRVLSAGGTLRIHDPRPAERAVYRRALAAVAPEMLPEGKRVKHQGRDRGDLVIQLADRAEDQVLPRRPVPVPEALDPDLPVIRHLAAHPGLLDVSGASRDRALLLIQALDEECRRSGHATAHRGEEPGLDLVIEGEHVTVLVSEEKDEVSRVPPEALAEVKYDWQRARPVVMRDWSGRLAMTLLTDRWSQSRWADRKRWTLDSRLPLLLERAEEVAKDRIDARARADQAKAERHRLWEESVPRARQAYIDELNRERLAKQLEAYTGAQARRLYADAVGQAASDMQPGPEREAAQGWAAWIRNEADRLDPALGGKRLHFMTPDNISPWELSKYMPNGWSVSYPPD